MDFAIKWRLWINEGLKSTRASILVNGSPTEEFSMGKCVRQSDLFSPFLFVIEMEGLNIAMQSAGENGYFHGVKIPHGGTTISHVFYADAALFIGEWCRENIMNRAEFLDAFMSPLV